MVNQALRIRVAYRSKEEKKEEEENTRDRSVPDGSDNQIIRLSMKANQYWKMTYQTKVDFTIYIFLGKTYVYRRVGN